MAPNLPQGPVGRSGARRASFLVLVAVLVLGAVAVTMGPSLATHPAAGQTRAAPTPRHDEYVGAPIAVAAAHDELARLAAFGQPIYCGAGTKPLVALTFDDGPGVLTPRALKHLRRRRAAATFFLVGKLLDEPSFAAIASFEARQGMAFGNHTWDHVTMSHGSSSLYAREIAATSTAIQRATGQWPRLFRPPFGAHDRRLDSWLRSHGMLEILWSTDSLDSQGATTGKVLKTVLRGIRPGAIILMHDNRGTTETALPRILQVIHRRGLRAVTVQQLLTQDPPTEAQLQQHTCP
jgi:peptidoglycan-N-acetylglucosamine deacetylase